MEIRDNGETVNWYKKAQSYDYSTWLAEQILKITDNYKKPLPPPFGRDKSYNFKDEGLVESNFAILENWAKETMADLSKLSLSEAWKQAYNYNITKQHKSEKLYDLEQIQRNVNAFYADAQNINPDAPNFAVDPRQKAESISSAVKRKINNAIHDLGNYHQKIPVEQIFDICKANGVVPLQEDGTEDKSMLIGGAECGSKEAEGQRADFDLATLNKEGKYVPANNMMYLSWCKMPSGRYEIVCYVS